MTSPLRTRPGQRQAVVRFVVLYPGRPGTITGAVPVGQSAFSIGVVVERSGTTALPKPAHSSERRSSLPARIDKRTWPSRFS